jgi:hypothetical protein
MRLLFFLIWFFNSFTVISQVSKSFSLGSSFNFGNLNSININTQSSFSKDTGKLNWSLSPIFQYTLIRQSQKYVTFEREAFITSSVSHQYGKWKLIGFADMENSFLRKVLFRGSFGLGVGYTLVDIKNWKFTVSEVLMPEYFLSEDKNVGQRFTLRPSTRIKLKYSNKINFESITFFQPPIWTSGNIPFKNNINFRTTNTVDVPVAKRLSLGAQFMMQLFTLPAYFDSSIKMMDSRILFILKITL